MYYKLIISEGLNRREENGVILEDTNSIIQLSSNELAGYKPVIEEEKPEEVEGYFIASDYRVINGEVHLCYHLEEIVEAQEELIDNVDNT